MKYGRAGIKFFKMSKILNSKNRLLSRVVNPSLNRFELEKTEK